MAVRDAQSTSKSARAALRPDADVPVARIVIVLLIVLAVGAWFLVSNLLKTDPSTASEATQTVVPFDARTILTDSSQRFLPTPVAALPPEADVAAPAALALDAPAEPQVERVKVANTGGTGAILRAEPPKGRQVTALRDGTQLVVLEHRQVDTGPEWLRVQTPDGTEGWIFSSLVTPET